jgi:hypothetical protein
LRHTNDIPSQYKDYLYSAKKTNALGDYYKQLALRLCDEYVIKSGELIVDIGSYDGMFLSAFKQNGIQTLGIEPSESASLQASENEIETFNEYFTSETVDRIRNKYGHPRLVTINYTVANIPNLSDFFESLRELMDDKSILSVLTGYHPDQFQVNMFDYIGHDHLSYFTLSDFQYIANQFGLKLIDVSRTEHRGGSILVTIARDSSHYLPKTSVKQLLQRESWIRSRENFSILELIHRIDEISAISKNILSAHSTKAIYGVGASISTSYLLNYLGISEYINSLYDDDPNKIGRYSPGTGIEVFGIDQIPKNFRFFSGDTCLAAYK